MNDEAICNVFSGDNDMRYWVSAIAGKSCLGTEVDYTIRDSVDIYGNLYIRAWSTLPSVLTFVNNDGSVPVSIYLTKYTRQDGHAGHPKIVSLDDGRYLLLWERFSFSTQPANRLAGGETGYLSTFALVINENGEAVSDVQELEGIRLNINDTLRYNRHTKRVYWAINDSDTSITVYALDIGGFVLP